MTGSANGTPSEKGQPMRISVPTTGTAGGRPPSWDETVTFVCEAERLGVDFAWSAEAWGSDAATPLAFLAAKTSRIRLGTAIMQVTARTPVMTAMTALSLAQMSGGRFSLGLGASGPQVVEALHGIPFTGQLGRMREVVEIVRKALRGERIEFTGKHFHLPLEGSEARPLRLMPSPDAAAIPIYLAAMSPRGLELTGELADGWLGHSFVPEAADAYLGPLAAGAQRAGRTLQELDLQAGGALMIGDDVEGLVKARKPGLAFSLGAMGSARKNFYADAYRRAGFEEETDAVQALWLDGKRDEATQRVTDEMVLRSQLVGNVEMIRERVCAYRDAGITTLRVAPEGRDLDERLESLAQVIALVRESA